MIYHFTTTKNRINQLQSTPRNMVANESARMAFDYHKPSKHLLQKSPWFKPLETAHFPNAITTGTHPSKSQKPMGLRFFFETKKIHPTSLQRSNSPQGEHFQAWKPGFVDPFFVISTAVFFWEKISKSEAHESFMASKRFRSSSGRSAVFYKKISRAVGFFVKKSHTSNKAFKKGTKTT